MFHFQWLILRFAALFTLLGILIDLEIAVIISGFLFLHINIGLNTIIYDYIHINKIKIMFLMLTRISIIEITRYMLELLI